MSSPQLLAGSSSTPASSGPSYHLDTLIDAIKTDRRVLVHIVRHLLAEVRSTKVAPPAVIAIHPAASTSTAQSPTAQSPEIASDRFAYREPRTIAEEMAAMDQGKRKRTAPTHFEGIPLSMINQPSPVPAVTGRLVKASKRVMGLEMAMRMMNVDCSSTRPSEDGGDDCTDTSSPMDTDEEEEGEEESDDEDDVVFVM